MKVTFKDSALEELYKDGTTKSSKYKALCRDKKFVMAYQDVIEIMEYAPSVSDLRNVSHLHYEKLRYRIESSVRIINGRVERLTFTEMEDGLEVELIEIDKNHYGKKK